MHDRLVKYVHLSLDDLAAMDVHGGDTAVLSFDTLAVRIREVPLDGDVIVGTERGDFLVPSVNAAMLKSIDELGPLFAYSRRTPVRDTGLTEDAH